MAFVQYKNATGFSVTSLAPVLAGVAAGNLLAMQIGGTTTTVTISGVAGNSNTYTNAAGPTAQGTSYEAWLYYAKNVNSGSTTITVTFSAAQSYAEMSVHEVSGCDTSAPLDQALLNPQSSPGGGTDAWTSTAVTTTANGEYIFGCSGNANAATQTAGTNYTLRSSASVPSSEDQIQTNAGSIAATFTAGDAFAPGVTGIMTFKAAAVGPTAAQEVPIFDAQRSGNMIGRVDA